MPRTVWGCYRGGTDQSYPAKPLNDQERYARLDVREPHLIKGGEQWSIKPYIETIMAYGSINLVVKARTGIKVTEFLVVDRPAS